MDNLKIVIDPFLQEFPEAVHLIRKKAAHFRKKNPSKLQSIGSLIALMSSRFFSFCRIVKKLRGSLRGLYGEYLVFLRPTIPFEARGKTMYNTASMSQPKLVFALSFGFFTNSF